MIAHNPYRKALMARPRSWRNLLASDLLIWASRIGKGQVAALMMSTAWAMGWRPVAEPEPPTSSMSDEQYRATYEQAAP